MLLQDIYEITVILEMLYLQSVTPKHSMSIYTQPVLTACIYDAVVLWRTERRTESRLKEQDLLTQTLSQSLMSHHPSLFGILHIHSEKWSLALMAEVLYQPCLRCAQLWCTFVLCLLTVRYVSLCLCISRYTFVLFPVCVCLCLGWFGYLMSNRSILKWSGF